MKTISSDYKKSEQEREFDNSCNKARSDSISYIGLSKKSSGRIAGWLLKKGYPDSIVQFVINDLITEGVIDDEILAKAILRSRKDQKVESSYSALQRLLRLGIAKETAKKCVQESFKDHNRELSDSIMLLRLKFIRKIDTMDEMDQEEQYKFKQKIFRFLLSRGYNREIALTAMNIVLKDNTFDEE